MRIAILTLLSNIHLNIYDQNTGKEIAGYSYSLVGQDEELELCHTQSYKNDSIEFTDINRKLGIIEDIDFLTAYFGCIARLIQQHYEEETGWLLVIPDDLSENSVKLLVEIVRKTLESRIVIIREYGLAAGLRNGQIMEEDEDTGKIFCTLISRLLSNSNTRMLLHLEESISLLEVGIINSEGFIKLFNNGNQLPVRLISRLSPVEHIYREDFSLITFVGIWQSKKKIKIATYDLSKINMGPGSPVDIVIEFGHSYDGTITFTNSSGSSVSYEISLPRLIYGV